MNKVLRWVILPIIYIVLAILAVIITHYYFKWLLPLDSLKDWIIFLLLSPLSFFVLASQGMAIVASTNILPIENKILGASILLVQGIVAILYSLVFMDGDLTETNSLINLASSVLGVVIVISFIKQTKLKISILKSNY